MSEASNRKALEFVKENILFFAAPLENQKLFQQWVEGSKYKQDIINLTHVLKAALGSDLVLFYDAIIGKALTENDKECLLNGNDSGFIALLEKNPRLSDAILVIKDNPAITQWKLDDNRNKIIIIMSSEILKLEDKRDELVLRGYKDASKAATKIADELNELLGLFKNDPNAIDIVGQTNQIISDNRGILDEHRGFKQIFGNILLAVAGLGVLYVAAIVINKAVTGNFLFFNKTDTSLKLDSLEDNLNQISLATS